MEGGQHWEYNHSATHVDRCVLVFVLGRPQHHATLDEEWRVERVVALYDNNSNNSSNLMESNSLNENSFHFINVIK